ncbi:MAG TPA: Asp-tRNA(Asn)/Glu-tRNA(Gln) amidotransferase subunit GatA [Candidatus Saccharimonadales bacterium]|nr:Asp-tRNA(Asn)/Glu-tRNA(Gln) amidotransferase subunit GatA [Candidatus Saccharimonadales bacterium]
MMDDKHKAFLKVFDTPIQAKKSGSLAGMKLAIKDNILIKGEQATAGSKILEGFVAPYDATVIKKLKDAGAIFIGKTNLDEFAMGSSTENSAYGATLNPWNEKLVPGGSSGGSAAAVADDLCDASLGSDTGGSIRQPAAFCGVTGLKPTYGAVSRYGLIALASSLDQIGPFSRSAENVEKVLEVISGRDEHDQTSANFEYKKAEVDTKKLRVGLPKELWQLSIDPEISVAVKKFIDWLEKKGATVTGISLPSLKYGLSAYYIIMPAEAMANLARYDGIRYRSSAEAKSLMEKYLKTRSLGFGTEVKRRILLGTFVLSVGHYDDYYQTAVKVRQLIKRQYEEAFKKVDVIISATTPTLPFELGAKTQDPLAMYQSDLLTVSTNLAGLPGLSLPCGFSKSGLPIGAQVVGPAFHENVLLSLAKQYQKETNYHLKKPQR